MTTKSNRGKAWELLIDRFNDHYRCLRKAVVFHSRPEVSVLGPVRGGKFRACWVATGPPDYTGVAGGRPVCFDAKDCQASRFPLSAIQDHQARDLEAWMVNGGTAFIALRIQGVGYVILWETLGPMWWRWRQGGAKRGEASITGELGTQMATPGDWLSAL